ncbi:MAG: hypothetical protein EOO86_01185 [Pedobacter sp.]|nr:MAG: hypothetical protein EOO86_01185 [Pedobacter sp.]
MKIKQTPSLFTGSYEGLSGGKNVAIVLTAKDSKLTGSLLINGESAQITGLVQSNLASGQIKEDISGKVYSFTAERKLDALNFLITFPEYNNQIVKMELIKTKTVFASTSGKNRDQKLIGTWRNTEVISSGSGEFYSSFSTDYFATFNADGTALIWTGKSAGGSKSVMIDANASNNVQKMEWYTAGKSLYLVDPRSKKESFVTFYAEPSRMMLTSNSSKKVYHRVR